MESKLLLESHFLAELLLQSVDHLFEVDALRLELSRQQVSVLELHRIQLILVFHVVRLACATRTKEE